MCLYDAGAFFDISNKNDEYDEQFQLGDKSILDFDITCCYFCLFLKQLCMNEIPGFYLSHLSTCLYYK